MSTAVLERLHEPPLLQPGDGPRQGDARRVVALRANLLGPKALVPRGIRAISLMPRPYVACPAVILLQDVVRIETLDGGSLRHNIALQVTQATGHALLLRCGGWLWVDALIGLWALTATAAFNSLP